jgi:KUP system potassium uptake protein
MDVSLFMDNTSAAAADHANGQSSSPNGHSSNGHGGHARTGFLALAVGSCGVVFGDIGTSPLYALREALHHAKEGGVDRSEVIGVVSLALWAMIIVVTIKYVVFIMSADNKGEGGTLSLMALVQQKLGRGMGAAFILGVIGASLFYGDSVITPAVSILGAIEGLKFVSPAFEPYIVTLAVVIVIALFSVQSRGTGSVAKFFGPIMIVWFLIIAVLGIRHISDDLSILWAFSPHFGVSFLFSHGIAGFYVLGSVFLCVTGAEALYADMGHFGRNPIRAAWLFFVFPCLALCYLGQGSMILSNPVDATIDNAFYGMAPEWFLVPLILLATVASVIASQAVITGAFSLTAQAVQLGLLPRLEIRHTSETQAGQIYLPQVNRMLMIGVIILILAFKNSSALANAYGIAVTGSMLADTCLFFMLLVYVWKKSFGLALLIAVPFLLIDMIFFGANLLKLLQGAYMPLLFGALLILMMWTWVRGSGIVYDKERRESVGLTELLKMLEKSKPTRVAGTAVFLTSDPEMAPGALMHNLKHNKVLHKRNIILTIKTAGSPRVAEADKMQIEDLSDDVKRIVVTIGYMEQPRVPTFLAMARRKGLDFDIMQTSFFLGRRTIRASATSGMPLWQDGLFIRLTKSATNATDFFHIPSGRVVELGSQVTV